MSVVTNIQQLKTELPFKIAVAAGKIPGWRWFRKFGMNDAVGTGAIEDCWPPGTVRVLPATAYVASLSSDDVNDNGVTPSTGALTVTVEGLDSAYVEVSEVVTLNGAAAVTTTQTFLRLNRMSVTTAGTSERNEGNISATLNGVLQAYIEALEGQTHQTLYTVPAGHTWIINDYHIKVGRMAGNTDAQVSGQVKPFGGAWRFISDIYVYGPDEWHAFDSVSVIPAKSEVRVQINSSGATELSAVAAGYLVDNNYL